jgi:hypothetical protein
MSGTHRRLQFSLKQLLALTFVCALLFLALRTDPIIKLFMLLFIAITSVGAWAGWWCCKGRWWSYLSAAGGGFIGALISSYTVEVISWGVRPITAHIVRSVVYGSLLIFVPTMAIWGISWLIVCGSLKILHWVRPIPEEPAAKRETGDDVV